MAKSKSWGVWMAWVLSGLSIVLTGLGAMFPEQAKALGTKIVEHWDWIGPLLAMVAYVVFFVLVFREFRRVNTSVRKINRKSRKMNKLVQQIDTGHRDQTTRIGAAVDRIETLERKVIDPDV